MAFETWEFGECIFDELCQVVDIAQDDVEAVVVSAGNVESRFDFGDGKDAIFEISNRLDLVLSQVDHDECFTHRRFRHCISMLIAITAESFPFRCIS